MEAKDRVKIITDWIKDYVESMDSPANCLVVGVSGGIDSSVVSTLCARTGIKTLVASMPISQRPEHHDLSIKHSQWLSQKFTNAYSVELDLTGAFMSFENILIDKTSADLLKGSEVDYVSELIGEQFKITNPQTKSSCGCGVSFSL